MKSDFKKSSHAKERVSDSNITHGVLLPIDEVGIPFYDIEISKTRLTWIFPHSPVNDEDVREYMDYKFEKKTIKEGNFCGAI